MVIRFLSLRSARRRQAAVVELGRPLEPMNKWQIICPVVAMLLFSLVLAFIALRGQHRGYVRVATRSIGSELIASTNSTHLVHIGSDLQARLAELLSVRTTVASVMQGDEPAPFGDGTASSRLVLSNEVGRVLMIRLRSAESGKFHVLGFRTVSE